MTSVSLGVFQRPEYGMGRSFALSALVHILLAAILFLGVRWQVSPPDTVSVDLVEAPPPPPPPAPVVEAPKPPPPAPKVEPEVKPPPPPVKQPDIAIREKPKPKPKPEPKKVETKPKPDVELQKRMLEQLALEQRALDQQRQERELRELIARQQAEAARQQAEAARKAAAARASALADYIARITAKVRGNWILPQDIQGNPEAIFLVIQLPTGEVLSTKLVKSSGNPSYDQAVERAILKSSPLPLPNPRDLFERELKLTFKPRDK